MSPTVTTTKMVETAAITARRGELEADENLSTRGKGAQLSARVRVDLGPLRRLSHEVRRVKEIAAERRSKITLQVDRTDIVGEMQRAEIRAWLRSVGGPKAAGVALSDPVMAEAVLLAPAAMSGMTPETHDQLRETALRAKFGPEIDELAVLDEAIARAEQAVGVSRNELLDAVDRPEPEVRRMVSEVCSRPHSRVGRCFGAVVRGAA